MKRKLYAKIGLFVGKEYLIMAMTYYSFSFVKFLLYYLNKLVSKKKLSRFSYKHLSVISTKN